MANERLPMRKIRDVLRLRAEGLSQRDIGLSLGVSRGSVRAYLVRASEVGLSWPLPDDLSDEDIQGALKDIRRICDPFTEQREDGDE